MNGTPLSSRGHDESGPLATPELLGAMSVLLQGRFEATFPDEEAAKAAARDARAVDFVVDVSQESAGGWLIVGRRKHLFPRDERDRYASRLNAIATRHNGAFCQFVEEPREATISPE